MKKATRSSTFGREIAWVLVLKLALITGLWHAFFRQPVDRTLTDRSVSAHILTTTDTTTSSKIDTKGAR